MTMWVAALLAISGGVTTPTYDRPPIDVTPGCVSADEYNSVMYVARKPRIEMMIHAKGKRVMLFDDVDFTTGLTYNPRASNSKKFLYTGCTGDMYVIYLKNARGWYVAEMNYAEFLDNRVGMPVRPD